MAVVNLKIAGKDYQVACDDGQEEHLRLLADDIDDRVRSLLFSMGSNPGEEMALLMTALTMADELLESKEQADHWRAQASQQRHIASDSRMVEMEAAMTVTLEEIALRIEKIADQIEIG